MGSDLPPFDVAYKTLCAHGAHIEPEHRRIVRLNGIAARDGNRILPVLVDTFAMQGVGQLYAGEEMRILLNRQMAVGSNSLTAFDCMLGKAYSNRNRLLIGFSGYGTAGRPYDVEAQAMQAVLARLRQIGQVPSLIVDGGVSDGVPGLSGLLAKRAGVSSLGFVPKSGLDAIGPRDHLVVRKSTFQERERLVGLAPDAIICLNGHDATVRECVAAGEAGSVILLLAFRSSYDHRSFAGRYETLSKLRKTMSERRLRVCRDPKNLLADVRWMVQTALEASVPNRRSRQRTINTILAT